MSNPQRDEEGEMSTYLASYAPISSHALGMVIKAAIELGVFDAMAVAGPNAELTASEIAEKLQVSINEKGALMLDRMLEFLAAHSILTCSSTAAGDGRSWKRFGRTPISRLMANREDGLSFAPLILLKFHKDVMDSWQFLKEAVQEGVNPFRRAHGVSMFEYMAKNPSLAGIFNAAMKNRSILVTENIIKKYEDGLRRIDELVDVGGGTGATLASIVSKFPHIRGVNFDLPQVISQAPPIPGVEHVGGDMFNAIPSGGAILLKWVLHNWDDERCLEILRNCWRALPPSGKAIVVEYVLPESSEMSRAASEAYDLSMTMMVVFDEAKERTEREYRSLAERACFSEFVTSCEASNHHVMEFVK